MYLNAINNLQYVDWKVKPVMHIRGTFGFRVVLVMLDESEKVQQKSGFSTKKEAEKERNNVITALTNETYIVDNNIKLKNFLIYWLEEIMRKKITHNTYSSYKNAIYNHIIPKIGNKNLVNLDTGIIQSMYKAILEKTESGVITSRTVLKTAFKYAIEINLMEYNPVIKAKLPKAIKSKPYRVLNIDSKKTLTLEQVKVLINASKNTKIYLQILFGVLMWLRKSEINGLKYSDIDYTHRKIKVERQLGIKPNSKKEDFAPNTYGKQEIKLKTLSSYREIDIPDIVFEAILEEREVYEANRNRRKKTFQDLDYICCSVSGRPRSSSYVYKYYKQILKDNNLPDIRWHDLRKTLATLLLKNNYSPKAVASILGHSKEIITVDIYGDNQNMIEGCLEELEPYIEEVVPKIKYKNYYEDFETLYVIEEFINEIKDDIEKIKNEVILHDFSIEDDYNFIIEKFIEENEFYINKVAV